MNECPAVGACSTTDGSPKSPALPEISAAGGDSALAVRPAAESDLPALRAVYAAARRCMAESGNPTQWGQINPREALLRADIAAGRLYAVCAGGAAHGAFALLDGDEPAYAAIRDGAWLDASPYTTIHRLASDGAVHGVFAACLAFCAARRAHLRIDTHPDNRIMLRLIGHAGFARCGIVTVEDGTDRIAFERSPSVRAAEHEANERGEKR